MPAELPPIDLDRAEVTAGALIGQEPGDERLVNLARAFLSLRFDAKPGRPKEDEFRPVDCLVASTSEKGLELRAVTAAGEAKRFWVARRHVKDGAALDVGAPVTELPAWIVRKEKLA